MRKAMDKTMMIIVGVVILILTITVVALIFPEFTTMLGKWQGDVLDTIMKLFMVN